ncbi:lymphocyte antigen 6L isoform X1 [Equus caballus]|uniref:lymphocyte antigen 6L isoform X1 n=1 Tax=Equus caballus TaxID=9796 RepID=UPI000717C414
MQSLPCFCSSRRWLEAEAEPSGIMEGLVLGLWALLVSAEFGGGSAKPGLKLSCYQCFKVSSPASCEPTVCNSTDQVCVSNEVFVNLDSVKGFFLSKHCAPRCPNTNMMFKWVLNPGVVNSITRKCCSRNLCNRALASQGRPWALQMGFLLQVGLSLLWALL